MRRLRADQAGLSLVEVMIAYSIALLIIATTFTAFLQQHRAQEKQRMLSELDGSTRMPLTLMSKQIRLAFSHGLTPVAFCEGG